MCYSAQKLCRWHCTGKGKCQHEMRIAPDRVHVGMDSYPWYTPTLTNNLLKSLFANEQFTNQWCRRQFVRQNCPAKFGPQPTVIVNCSSQIHWQTSFSANSLSIVIKPLLTTIPAVLATMWSIHSYVIVNCSTTQARQQLSIRTYVAKFCSSYSRVPQAIGAEVETDLMKNPWVAILQCTFQLSPAMVIL